MIGLAFAVLTADATVADEDEAVSFLTESTPQGRFGAVAWPMVHEWRVGQDIEGGIVARLLGDPEVRTEDRATEEWLLHSNLFVRGYRHAGESPSETWQAILFRRHGDAPYTRLRARPGAEVSDALRSASTIDVANPAFTRDVANNVWHLAAGEVPESIMARLSRLTCWADEEVVELHSGGERRTLQVASLQIETPYVPVAVKEPYTWEHLGPGGQTELFAAIRSD